MITLIHGNDFWLSQIALNEAKKQAFKKGLEVKIIDCDDTEKEDSSFIYAELSEQDLFGSEKLLVLKRITSSPLFFKLGRPLKENENLLTYIKSCAHDIVIWEDKILTNANPLYKLTNNQQLFKAPAKDWEVKNYIRQNFKNYDKDLLDLIANNVNSLDTEEIYTEFEKLKFTPKKYLSKDILATTMSYNIWSLNDCIMDFLKEPSATNLTKILHILHEINEDVRFKLVIIQNVLTDIFVAKYAKNDTALRDKHFGAKRNFVYQKLSGFVDKLNLDNVYKLFEKTILIEYLLNTGLISEAVSIEYIFCGDSRSVSSELVFG